MIRLQLLGNISLDRDGRGPIPTIRRPKLTAILAYLAASEPGARHRRDSLVAMFWPDLDEEHARNALRQSLYSLRRELGEDVVPSEGKDLLGLDPTRLWCDAQQLQVLLSEGADAEALSLYRGPLLPGFHLASAPDFVRWLDQARRWYSDAASSAAWRLMQRDEGRGDVAAARAWAERAMALTPYDEEGFRRYVQLLLRHGNQPLALRAYAAFSTRLEQDLGLRPSEDTAALVRPVGQENGQCEPVLRSTSTAITVPGLAAVHSSPPAPSAPAARRSRNRRLPYLLAGAGLALLIALYGWFGTDPREPATPIRSVLVLPLENLSGNPAEDYLSFGITDALITELGQVPSLEVISHHTAMLAKAGRATIPQLADQLGVDGVIEGAVLRADGRVRVSVRLIDGVSDRELWSGRFGSNAGDLLELQERVARSIVTELRAEVTPEASSLLASARPVDPEAYAEYLRGRYQLTLWRGQSFGSAKAAFREAIDIDSTYAPAYAGFAYALVQECYFALAGAPPRTVCQSESESAAMRAVQLDPASSDAQLALAMVRWWGHRRDVRAAERALVEALRLNPGNAQAHSRYGFLLSTLERHDEAIREFERAYALDPLSPERAAFVAWAYGAARRFAEGEQAARRAIELEPAFPSSHAWLAYWILGPQGRFDEAVLHARRAVELAGDNALFRSYLAHALGRAGQTAEAERVLAQLSAEITQRRGPPFQIAIALAGLGRHEEALDMLDRTFDEGWGHIIYLTVNPAFDPLRGHHRYEALVRRIGLRATPSAQR